MTGVGGEELKKKRKVVSEAEKQKIFKDKTFNSLE